MNRIAKEISKGIKESKWIAIGYDGKASGHTDYWIYVEDIDGLSHRLSVLMFNIGKAPDPTPANISFERITAAKALEFTYGHENQALIAKIERDRDLFLWLDFDSFDINILNYLKECSKLDSSPYQKAGLMIPGIDLGVLAAKRSLTLTKEQQAVMVADIYHYDLRKSKLAFSTLALSVLAIDRGDQQYVLAYRELGFNPKGHTLAMGKELRFNKSFTEGKAIGKARSLSLFYLTEMDVDEFIALYKEDPRAGEEIIRAHLSSGKTNTQPRILIIEHDFSVSLAPTFAQIAAEYLDNTLPVPLKAFFGNISTRNLRRTIPAIVIYDRRINIDQMRVLFNAMSQPVTYVEGPPGTGKTQTLLNVVLSAFFNGKTVLVCSGNNRPVDGIVGLLNFQYRGRPIDFPYLRLGNSAEMGKALDRIKEIFVRSQKETRVPIDNLLKARKEESMATNRKLVQLLANYEARSELGSRLGTIRKLEGKTDSSSTFAKKVRDVDGELEAKLERLPKVTNQEVIGLFRPAFEDNDFLQYLSFESLRYLLRIKQPKFGSLLSICDIEDNDQRVREFARWLSFDENVKTLLTVFPIVFTTNISAGKLGSGKPIFDLAIMDEAGQCNEAHALLPIARADSLLLVGDMNQLRPVVLLDKATGEKIASRLGVDPSYGYCENSILSVMESHDNISKRVFLSYHYRCGRRIIQFSNALYYRSQLNLGKIKNEGILELALVKNEAGSSRNGFAAEADGIVSYLRRNGYEDTVILTPFRNQRDLINQRLDAAGLNGIRAETIHSMQGGEAKTVILSTAISPKTSRMTYRWLMDNQELINVAVTRAKQKLVVYADRQAIDLHSQAISQGHDDLKKLVDYVASNGNIRIEESEKKSNVIGKSNGSLNEDYFFQTICQFCSVHDDYKARRNVPLSSLFPADALLSRSRQEFDLVLYRTGAIIKDPKLAAIAIEIDGGEHMGDPHRESLDRRKAAICQSHGIRLLVIPNSLVKSYEYIKDLILMRD